MTTELPFFDYPFPEDINEIENGIYIERDWDGCILTSYREEGDITTIYISPKIEEEKVEWYVQKIKDRP